MLSWSQTSEHLPGVLESAAALDADRVPAVAAGGHAGAVPTNVAYTTMLSR